MNPTFRVKKFDNYRKLFVLHTFFLCMEYVLELGSILGGTKVMYI